MASQHRISSRCLHPLAGKGVCQGKIINSHTVSKSSSLRRIARDGHVYHFRPDLNDLLDNEGRFVKRSIGVSAASTFPGFCSHHDKQMFSPFEDKDFETNEITTFLLGFRALAKELYAKETALAMIPKMRHLDRGRSQADQYEIQGLLDAYRQGTELGLRDLGHHKAKYDAVFRGTDYSSSKYLVVRFSESPNILFSGSLYPEMDFAGRQLQRLGEPGVVLESMTANAIALPTGGALVIHWLGDSEVCSRFAHSLLAIPDEQKASAVTQFAFESFENLFICPDWWDALGAGTGTLESRVRCGSPGQPHTNNCLVPDGRGYYTWNNPVVETNAFD